MRYTISLAVLICILALNSCGGGSTSPATVMPASQPQLAAVPVRLPGLPREAPATRLPQAVTNHQFQDTDLHAAGGATMVGPDISLSAPGLTYAIVGIQMTGDRIPKMLHLTGTVTSEIWIGVSDYGHDYWDWRAPQTGPADIPLLTGDIVNGDDWFYAVLVCTDGNSADVQLSVDMDVETWNVMIWVAGDNNLASDAVDDLNELESVGSADNMNILAGFDIDPEYAPPTTNIDQVHFIKVVEDHTPGIIIVDGDPANQSFPRSGYNSADPANLVSFIDWCDGNFEASHTMLILWNHGDGWLYSAGGGGSGKGASTAPRTGSGVLGDDSDGSASLTNNADIVSALGTRHFDYLCFDACNMGQLEALHEYRDVADYIVASPMLEPGGGYPYDLWVADWQEFYPLPQQAIGSLLCARYCNYWDVQSDDGSMGMFAMGYHGALITALTALTAEVTPKGEAEGDAVKHAIQAAYKPMDSDGTADLGEFLTDYRAETSDPVVRALLDIALAAYADFVFEFDHTINTRGTGCGIFLPTVGELAAHRDAYRTTAFNQATSWLEMLEATGVPGGGSEWPTVDWEPGWRMIYEWDNAVPDIQLFIEGPQGDFGYPGDGAGLAHSILFSPDNLVSGVAEEWAELKVDGRKGVYLAAINYDSSGPAGPATIDVHAYLEDDIGALQYDFGTTTINRGQGDIWVGFLRHVGDVAGTWVPGDRLEVTWGSINAEMDLEVTDPLDNWGCCIWPVELEGIIEFSADSWDSDEPVEWARLLVGGSEGIYSFSVLYMEYEGSPPESMPVSFKLYDSTGTLKQDLGGHIFDGEFGVGEYSDPIYLQY